MHAKDARKARWGVCVLVVTCGSFLGYLVVCNTDQAVTQGELDSLRGGGCFSDILPNNQCVVDNTMPANTCDFNCIWDGAGNELSDYNCPPEKIGDPYTYPDPYATQCATVDPGVVGRLTCSSQSFYCNHYANCGPGCYVGAGANPPILCVGGTWVNLGPQQTRKWPTGASAPCPGT